MRKILLLRLLCFLALACALAGAQAKPKLSPAVRPFVNEDAPVFALTHVRVIDGTGAAARADQTLVIADGKIVALGDAATTKIPDGAKVLDLDRPHRDSRPRRHARSHVLSLARRRRFRSIPNTPPVFRALYLAGGVTSIRTTGSVEPYADLELKQRH